MPAFTRDKSNPQGHEEWKELYASWNEILASPTEHLYNKRLDTFNKRYISGYINDAGYIIETQIDLYQRILINAWVNQHLHFKQCVISRCEGVHQLIKYYMNDTNADLFRAWRIIDLVLSN
jgi:hypothetical protein